MDWMGLKGRHPASAFCLLMTCAVITMLCFHPAALILSFLGSVLACLCLCPKKLLSTLRYALPLSLILFLLNPLINHRGRTILFYLFGQQITLESIFFGMISAGILLSVLLWICVFNCIITGEKTLYLFGRAAPSFAMLLTMTIRMVPLFTKRLKEVRRTQRSIVKPASGLMGGVHDGVRDLTILLSWSMEDAIDTADSMKARGYGAAKRSAFSIYHFRWKDVFLLICTALLTGICVAGLCLGTFTAKAYPRISYPQTGAFGAVCWASLALLMVLPFLAELLDSRTKGLLL